MTDENVTPASEVVAVTPPVSEPGPAEPSRRDRLLGTAGQVAAVAGIVVCLLFVVGVLAGRIWVVSTVDDVAAAIDAQIAKAEPLLDQASVRIGEISGRVGAVGDVAAGIAADPSPGGSVAETLRTAVASVNERYQGMRANYADLRETVVSMVDRLQTLDRLVPGFSVPQGPIDSLSALNTRVQEFDAKLNDLLTIEPGQGPINQAAAAVAQKASDIETKFDGLQAGISDVQERITALRTKLSDTAGTIKLGVTLGTIGTILLLAWIAFLHWVLFRHSGEIRRRAPAV